jgi:FtsH-binding integral membrane protein
MYLTRSIDYHESPFAKHLALASFVGCQAVLMAPLAALGGPLLMRAALATGAVVGAISLTAATAPSQAYLSMTGPLAIGAGLIMGASLGSMFFPGANFLYSIVLWGGLALHGGMVFARTQNLIDGATRFPQARFDPINDSLGIYIDTVAIFWRMAMIMSSSQRKK